MSLVADPVWPVVVLALIQLVDAAISFKPVAFVAACFEDVGFPRRWWWIFTPIKLAAAAGLIAGIWVPSLGVITCAALIAYFVVAIIMHVAARDLGRTLFLNATGMLVICVATLLWSFVL
ncbi:DoxX family protein [Agromyces salentinus]|uniref:DoxX family protein n=1 Tax=Agromyces salentinus TaxID=269421 RepID=A0ABP4Z3T0_9MICO|nr:DoxX family protein [Agromyces salentinus]